MADIIRSSVGDFLCAGLILICGILLFIYRDQIGEFTGYYVGKYGYVDKPTPGLLLIPFAVILMAGGIIMIIRTISRM